MATSVSTSGPPSNTEFLRRIRANSPNGISIGAVVFAGLTAVTEARAKCDIFYKGSKV